MKKSDWQAKATELGIPFDKDTTVKELSALIQIAEAGNPSKSEKKHGDTENGKIYIGKKFSPGQNIFIDPENYKALSDTIFRNQRTKEHFEVVKLY